MFLLTAKDAKEGDVLSINNRIIVVFKDLYQNFAFHSYCYVKGEEFIMGSGKTPDWWRSDDFHPATKEQHELLCRKMKEAGYEGIKMEKN